MSGAVAIRNIRQTPAVRGPGDLRLFRHGEGDAVCVAAIGRRSGEYFSPDDEGYFLAIRGQSDLGNLIRETQVFYGRARRRAPAPNTYGGLRARGWVKLSALKR